MFLFSQLDESNCPALFFSTPHCTSLWPNLAYFFFPPNLIVMLVRFIFLISITFLHIFFFSIFVYAHLPGLDLSSFYFFLLLSNTNHFSKSTSSRKMFHNPNNYLFFTIHSFPLSITYTWSCIIYVLSLWIKLISYFFISFHTVTHMAQTCVTYFSKPSNNSKVLKNRWKTSLQI